MNEHKGIHVQLKEIGERLGIRNRVMRYLAEQNFIPDAQLKPGRGSPRELTEEQTFLIALAAVLFNHGFRGDAVHETVKRARSQYASGQTVIKISFRKPYPVDLKIDAKDIITRLELNHE